MIQWTTPFMLAGLGLLSLPIIAHLLSRRSRKKYFYSTNRFIAAAASQQNRLFRLRRWLLLLLRCLLLALIVFAFARPIWNSQNQNPSGMENQSVVIVVDISGSTTQRVGGQEARDQFLAIADRTLGDLKQGVDQANIVLAGADAMPLAPHLTRNFDLLRDGLNKAEKTFVRADIEGAVNEAIRQFSDVQGKKLLVIVSDMQESNWTTDAGEEFDLQIPSNIETKLVEFKPSTTPNFSLSNPRSTPNAPLPNQGFQLAFEIASDSTTLSQVPVKLEVLEGKSETIVVDVPPQSSAVVSFQIPAAKTTSKELTASIPEDRLDADNRLFFSPNQLAQTGVLLITDDPAETAGSSTFFMERALTPFKGIEDRFLVNTVPPRKLTAELLMKHPITVIAYVNQLSESACDALAKYVFDGGKVLLFCGEGNVDQVTERLNRQSNNQLLPFQVGKLERFSKFDSAPCIASGKWRSQWLRAFDLSSQVVLQQIRVPRSWTVTNLAQDADVLLSFSDDRPALAVRIHGKGEMLVANFSPSSQFSDLGTYGSFPALIQILMNKMTDDFTPPNPVVGQPVVFFPKASSQDSRGQSVRVDANLKPTKALITGPNKFQQEVPIEPSSTGTYSSETSWPGFYRIVGDGFATQTVGVNLDPEESELKQIAPDSIKIRSGAALQVAGTDSFGKGLVEQGKDLWGWLAITALGLFATESLLLGRWRQ